MPLSRIDLRESALFSFGINLFFDKQILIMLHLTTQFFVFFPKSSSKISNILESARKSASLLIFFTKSAQALRNQRIWEHCLHRYFDRCFLKFSDYSISPLLPVLRAPLPIIISVFQPYLLILCHCGRFIALSLIFYFKCCQLLGFANRE